MDSAPVNGIARTMDTQKAGALFKGLGPETGNAQHLAPANKRALLVSEGHDVFGQGRTQAGD